MLFWLEKRWVNFRAMFDFHGKKIRKAGPSTPVQIMGLSDVPEAGELFQVYTSEKEARLIVEERKAQQQQRSINAPKASTGNPLQPYSGW